MKSFSQGETLVYDVHGLCRVREIRRMSFVKSEPLQCYYVLSPLSNSSSVYYVPADNEKALSKLRRPLTKQEIEQILSQAKDESCEWIENRQLRTDAFHAVLRRGVTPELVSLIKCIYTRKLYLSEKGKKLSVTDEGVFAAAEKLLNEELAFVLGIKEDEVSGYIGSFFGGRE